jgi:hypothetical protein
VFKKQKRFYKDIQGENNIVFLLMCLMGDAVFGKRIKIVRRPYFK